MKRPTPDRLQALRDYYCEDMGEIVDGSDDVADLFAEIDALTTRIEELQHKLGQAGIDRGDARGVIENQRAQLAERDKMFAEAQDVNRDYAGRLEDALHAVAERDKRIEGLEGALAEFDAYASVDDGTPYAGSPFEQKIRATLADSVVVPGWDEGTWEQRC